MFCRVRNYSVLLFIFSSSFAFAQVSTDTTNYGTVNYHQDPQITTLINKHIICSENSKTISGYRVQIHFGSAREKSTEIRTKFLKLFPEVSAYEIYQQPNFKIRVGDFRTRIEAQGFQKQLASEFPSSFVVADQIQLPRLD